MNTNEPMLAPFSDEELAELEQITFSDSYPDDGMTIEAADGLMCALALAAARIDPSDFLPLMFGGNPARLADDAWTLALLTNEEVLGVNQDVLGAHGKGRAVDDGEIWTRDLSNGKKAVAFFNRGTEDTTMSASFEEIGVSGELVVRDVWRRTDASAEGDVISASVPGGAALLFVLSDPANTGTGGAGGSGGMGGSGGAEGSGVSST